VLKAQQEHRVRGVLQGNRVILDQMVKQDILVLRELLDLKDKRVQQVLMEKEVILVPRDFRVRRVILVLQD
jgi:hypothetical protein